MAELLGSQDCIKSLRKDLVDIHGAVLDVFSRTGPVQFTSWKFPDKLSCDLDILDLLEDYDFVGGEDAFNQHSHIVLLELVVDRLLLLLQSVSVYMEQQRGIRRIEPTQQEGCQSVGLVIKNFWSNVVQFTNWREIAKDMQKQIKTKAFDRDETKTMAPINSSCRSSTNSFKFSPQIHESSMPNHKALFYPQINRREARCQTTESSLSPCRACHQAQSLLRTTGKSFIDLLQNEGLPSSLQPLLDIEEARVEFGLMTSGVVAQWANDQLMDMRKLAKHLQNVRGTVQPLKEKLAATEMKSKQEVEKHQANIARLEFSLQEAQRSMKVTEQKLQEEQRELKREILSLEESNTKLKEEATLQQETLQALECEKKMLQEKLQKEEEACCRLQQRVQQLETQISDTQLLFDKENAKYQSACRQHESMQAKQKSLLERVDALDEECEELQRELGEREVTLVDLHNQLQQMSEAKEQLQTQLTQQQELCVKVQQMQAAETHDELKKQVAELTEHVRALKERERLLVAFPELNNCPQAQPQRDIILDMEEQMQANSIRIKALEQENATLHKCLEKLKSKAQHSVTKAEQQCSSSGTVGNGEEEVKGAQSGLQSAKSEDCVLLP